MLAAGKFPKAQVQETKNALANKRLDNQKKLYSGLCELPFKQCRVRSCDGNVTYLTTCNLWKAEL